MKTAEKINISKKERKYLLQSSINILGVERQLEMAIEEIAELINVLSLNILGQFDYIHTAEEIVDVMISTKKISLIVNTPIPRNLELDVGKQKMKLFTWYSQLSKAQQYISKYIRNGCVAKEKLILAMNLMESSTTGIIKFCNISKKDISRIETLKYKRLYDKIRNRELK